MVKKRISIRELKHQARRRSIKEGIFASAKVSFGERFIQPFAIAINSSNSVVAMFSSITGLLGPLSQLFSAKAFEGKSRKKIILKGVLIETLMWLPFIAVALLFYKGLLIQNLPFILLLAFALYIIISNSIYPLWFSWMGDIVDKKFRGRWFAKRHLITGFVSVILSIIASFFLDYFEKINYVMIGFAILFGLAMFFRFLTWITFKTKYEPKIKIKKKDKFSFIEFLKDAPKNNFGRFTIFRAFLAFSASIFAALLSVYLLRDLGFKYSTYMIIVLSELFFSLVFIRFWGNFSDKYGNYRVMQISLLVIPLTPVLWFLFKSPIYLILVPGLIGGSAWLAFTLASGNFIYDNVSKEKRSLAVSYYNMLWGIGIFLGAGLAAILIKYVNINFMKPIIFIFLISAIARLIVVMWWFPKIKEVRKTKPFNSKAFKKTFIKEVKHTMVEEIHEIASIRNYLKN